MKLFKRKRFKPYISTFRGHKLHIHDRASFRLGKNEMFKAITEVYEGRKYVCAEIKNILSSHISGNDEEKNKIESLSLREIEIIKHIKDGSSSKEIAQALFISVKTIEVHRYNILKKLKLKNAAALVNFINNHPELEM